MAWLLSGLGKASGIFGAGSALLGGVGAGFVKLVTSTAAIIRSIISKIASIISSALGALGRVGQSLIAKLPIGGISGVMLYTMLCNAGVIPCNRPKPSYIPMVDELKLAPPPPPKVPIPLEYNKPKMVDIVSAFGHGAQAALRPMSTAQPLPGFSITVACPWLIKVPSRAPTVQASYGMRESVILTRTSTQL